METFTLVRPEHLNHYGSLFGGQLLKWVDEFAWLAAARDFPHAHLVTRAMDRVSFTRGVDSGSLLRFQLTRTRLGTTSVDYDVNVFARPPAQDAEHPVFATSVTFVTIGPDGCKVPLQPTV